MGRKNKNARRGGNYPKNIQHKNSPTFYQKDLRNTVIDPQYVPEEKTVSMPEPSIHAQEQSTNQTAGKMIIEKPEQLTLEGLFPNQNTAPQAPVKHETSSFCENGQRIESIPLDAMFLGNYQRPVSMNNVKKIVNAFDSSRLGVLVVSERPNGKYAVIDGQHRMTALSQLGIKSASCIVLTGLTEQDEAEFFRHQNENTRSLNVRDRFKAGVIAKDENTLQIQSVMVKNGFYSEGGGHGTRIEAMAALQKIVEIYGLDILDRTLALANATWPGNRNAVSREMLSALMEFAHRFGESVSNAQFAIRMGSKDPQNLVQLIRQRNGGTYTRNASFSKQNRFNGCGVLVTEYNKGLGSTAKCRLHLNWDYTTED